MSLTGFFIIVLLIYLTMDVVQGVYDKNHLNEPHVRYKIIIRLILVIVLIIMERNEWLAI